MTTKIDLTDRQIELARHALCFSWSANKPSYRNRFYTGSSGKGADHADWLRMVAVGAAEMDGNGWFWLTQVGAEAVLKRGESLCKEDFPKVEVVA